MSFDPLRIRGDFPSLQSGKLIYFDNACTTLRPQVVIDAVTRYHAEFPACGERSLHRLGRRVDEEVALAREAARRFLGARRSEEIVFTQNTTHAINIVAQSFPFRAGEVVVNSDQEHNSNLLPWQQLARHGVRHRAVPFGDLDALARALTPEVKLVSMVMTSNLDGASIDPRRVVEAAHERGVPVLLDAAQAVPHQALDVRALDVDFLACSGHKMLGPSATGILYGKREWLGRLTPTLVGGGTVEDSTLETASYRDGPERFEAGLQNYAGIVGLRHAIEYLESIGREAVREHERALTRQLDEGLRRYGREREHRGALRPTLRPQLVQRPRGRGHGARLLVPLQHGRRGGRVPRRAPPGAPGACMRVTPSHRGARPRSLPERLASELRVRDQSVERPTRPPRVARRTHDRQVAMRSPTGHTRLACSPRSPRSISISTGRPSGREAKSSSWSALRWKYTSSPSSVRMKP
jgi:cysteine desulfurase / selenocysteine lyase